MTISISGAAISASASSVTNVVPAVAASANERAREALRGSQPVRASDARRAIGREIGDRRRCECRRVLRLREVHRAEFAGADQTDVERPARGGAREEQAMEIHGAILDPREALT